MTKGGKGGQSERMALLVESCCCCWQGSSILVTDGLWKDGGHSLRTPTAIEHCRTNLINELEIGTPARRYEVVFFQCDVCLPPIGYISKLVLKEPVCRHNAL